MIGLAQLSEATPAFTMLGILLGIVLAAGGILMWVRSRTLGGGSGRGGAGLFEDLARMRDAGELTDEEYAAAKRSVVDRMAGKMGSETGAGLSASPKANLIPEPPDEPNDQRSDLPG